MFRLELSRKAGTLAVFAAVLTALAALTFFGHDFIVRMMTAQYESVKNITNALPFQKKMLSAIEPVVQGDQAYYLWSQWTGRNLFQVLMLLAFIMGLFDILTEKEGRCHTLALNFASRGKVFRAKTFSGITGIVLLSLFGFILTALFMAVFRYQVPAYRVAAGFVPVTLSALLLYQASFGLSLFLRRKWNGLVLTTVLFLLLPVALGLYDPFLSAVTGRNALLTGGFPFLPALVITGITVMLWGLEYAAWEKLDL